MKNIKSILKKFYILTFIVMTLVAVLVGNFLRTYLDNILMESQNLTLKKKYILFTDVIEFDEIDQKIKEKKASESPDLEKINDPFK